MKSEEIKINPPRKLGFFKRIQVSIFKVENYGEFVLEKTRVAVKYFFLLMLLVSIVTSIFSTYHMNTIFTKGFSYIKNEMPDFTLENGIINFAENTTAYDEDLDFFVKYATDAEYSDSILSDIEKDIRDYTVAIVYLKDRIIYYDGVDYSYFKYGDIMSEYNFEIANRQDLIKQFDSVGIAGLDVVYFCANLLSSYIVNVISVMLDVLLVFFFGIIVAKLSGVNMPSSKMFSLSIYSLTLSIILSAVYSIVYGFTNFYIEYFDVMYIIVAYIYLIAAILIIKSDVIKQKLELQKIIEVQKQVKKEIEEQKEQDKEKEDNKEDDKEEDNKEKKKEKEDEPILNREPDGSEI